jgi:hypothetical protein
MDLIDFISLAIHIIKRIYSSFRICLLYLSCFFRQWRYLAWKYRPVVTIYCLLLVGFAIASMIVLGLLPLYLPDKLLDAFDPDSSMFYSILIRISSILTPCFADEAFFDLDYGTDVVDGSSLTITDLKTLADEVGHLPLLLFLSFF